MCPQRMMLYYSASAYNNATQYLWVYYALLHTPQVYWLFTTHKTSHPHSQKFAQNELLSISRQFSMQSSGCGTNVL